LKFKPYCFWAFVHLPKYKPIMMKAKAYAMFDSGRNLCNDDDDVTLDVAETLKEKERKSITSEHKHVVEEQTKRRPREEKPKKRVEKKRQGESQSQEIIIGWRRNPTSCRIGQVTAGSSEAEPSAPREGKGDASETAEKSMSSSRRKSSSRRSHVSSASGGRKTSSSSNTGEAFNTPPSGGRPRKAPKDKPEISNNDEEVMIEGEQISEAETTETEINLSAYEKPQRRSSRTSSGHRRRSTSTGRKSCSNSNPEPPSSSSGNKTTQPRRRVRESPCTADNKDDDGKGRAMEIVGWQRNVRISKGAGDDSGTNCSSVEKKKRTSSRSRKPAHLRIYQSKNKAGRSPGRKSRSMEDLSLFAESDDGVVGSGGGDQSHENSAPSKQQSPNTTEDAFAVVWKREHPEAILSPASPTTSSATRTRPARTAVRPQRHNSAPRPSSRVAAKSPDIKQADHVDKNALSIIAKQLEQKKRQEEDMLEARVARRQRRTSRPAKCKSTGAGTKPPKIWGNKNIINKTNEEAAVEQQEEFLCSWKREPVVKVSAIAVSQI
jgi:hypothetical protein